MPEIPDVIPGADVESTWGNDIRSRTLMRYTDQASLSASILTPDAGDFAYVIDESAVKVWTGAAWIPVALPDVDGNLVVAGALTVGEAGDTDAHNLQIQRQIAAVQWRNGFLIQADGTMEMFIFNGSQSARFLLGLAAASLEVPLDMNGNLIDGVSFLIGSGSLGVRPGSGGFLRLQNGAGINQFAIDPNGGANEGDINLSNFAGQLTHNWDESADTWKFHKELSMTGAAKITNVLDPTADQDAATKAYVDAGQAWAAPTLVNGYSNFAGGFQDARYRKIHDVVYFEGMLNTGSTALSTTITTFPSGFRPNAIIPLNCMTSAGARRMDIEPGGTLKWSDGDGTPSWVSFNQQWGADN